MKLKRDGIGSIQSSLNFDHHWNILIMTRLIFSLLLILSLFLSGCSNLTEPSLPTAIPTPEPSPQKYNFTGRVVDIDGDPIPGASVNSQTSHTTSNNDGWFELPSK